MLICTFISITKVIESNKCSEEQKKKVSILVPLEDTKELFLLDGETINNSFVKIN